jgi:hypothetical protein
MVRIALGSWIFLIFAIASSNLLAADAPKPRPLSEAVKEFNQKAQKDPTGKNEPPLSEDEVVAAIRGWIREQVPASDPVYNAFQNVAKTKQLPPNATLTFTTNWEGFNGLDFDVWWIDLTLFQGPKSGYTYRLRDRKIRCRPMDASGDVLIVPAGQRDKTQ